MEKIVTCNRLDLDNTRILTDYAKKQSAWTRVLGVYVS